MKIFVELVEAISDPKAEVVVVVLARSDDHRRLVWTFVII
jgi:hypothetical protein